MGGLEPLGACAPVRLLDLEQPVILHVQMCVCSLLYASISAHVQTLDHCKGAMVTRSGEAVGAYQRALDLKPNYMRAWANMGISQARGPMRSAAYPVALAHCAQRGCGVRGWLPSLSRSGMLCFACMSFRVRVYGFRCMG